MGRPIELPPGDWKMKAFGGAIYLISPEHPPLLVEGGEVKELSMAESEAVFFAYDSQMNGCQVRER